MYKITNSLNDDVRHFSEAKAPLYFTSIIEIARLFSYYIAKKEMGWQNIKTPISPDFVDADSPTDIYTDNDPDFPPKYEDKKYCEYHFIYGDNYNQQDFKGIVYVEYEYEETSLDMLAVELFKQAATMIPRLKPYENKIIYTIDDIYIKRMRGKRNGFTYEIPLHAENIYNIIKHNPNVAIALNSRMSDLNNKTYPTIFKKFPSQSTMNTIEEITRTTGYTITFSVWEDGEMEFDTDVEEQEMKMAYRISNSYAASHGIYNA